MSRVGSASPFERRYGFSRALRVGDRVEVAGTAPIPQDGGPVPDSAREQMLLCGRIALDAMAQLGAGVDDVVRTRLFITDVADADEIGIAHREVFGGASPVATMIVVGGLLNPAWKVEIEVEAVISNSTRPDEVVS
ncbi:MAG: RidA family protein [Acidimicrobiia bacterium]|nr:RidA family protein [Acidimicrobiia bacterium]